MSSNLPLIDEARIKSLFSELENMEVDLDDDPLVFGPKQLNGKVSTVRRMLTRCERVFLQVSYDLQLYKRTHRSTSMDFDLQMQDLLANDIEVRAGRNVRDRDAIATMKLRASREEVMGMEVGIQDLEMLMSVIKAKRADLRDLQGRLRDQIKLCQEEVGLGSRWGSRPPVGASAPNLDNAPRVSAKALAEVQALVSTEASAETHLQAGDSNWIDEEDESAILAKLSKIAESGDDGEEDTEDTEDSDVEEDSVQEVCAYRDPALLTRDVTPETTIVEDDLPPWDTSTTPMEVTVTTTEIDIFAEDEPEEKPEVAPIPSVSSDKDVDNMFEMLDAHPASIKKTNLPSATIDDIDSLIDMFGG